MTIDKQKLKALAEAATPGRHYDRLESAGGGIKYECAGDDGSLVLKVDHKNNEFGFVGDRGEADEAFFLACSPAAVLALLAEIERLESAKGDPVGSFDKHMEYMQENIRLKAENEDYRSGQDRYEQIIDDLKAENEALRKDAKRYRFLRNQHWPVAELSVVCNPKVSVKLGHDCPSGDRLDQQVDGAMIRGASHD